MELDGLHGEDLVANVAVGVRGEVVAVGPGKRLENGKRAEMSVRKGDKVFYGKYAGTEVEFKGDKMLILRENELLGVVEG